MKHYEDPKWAHSMQLSLDHNYAMAEFLGESGLTETETLQGLAPRLRSLHQSLASQREGYPEVGNLADSNYQEVRRRVS